MIVVKMKFSLKCYQDIYPYAYRFMVIPNNTAGDIPIHNFYERSTRNNRSIRYTPPPFSIPFLRQNNIIPALRKVSHSKTFIPSLSHSSPYLIPVIAGFLFRGPRTGIWRHKTIRYWYWIALIYADRKGSASGIRVLRKGWR